MTTQTQPTERPKQDDQSGDALGEAIAGLAGLIWLAASGVIKLISAGVLGAMTALIWAVRASTTGRWRHHIAPFWLAAAAVVTAWIGGPSAGWYWMTVACAVEATTLRRSGRESTPWRILSRRERRLLACTLAVIAAVLDLAPAAGLTWRWPAAAVTVTVLAAAVPWWRGRHVSSRRPAVLDRWENEVVAHDDRFAGEWVDFDQTAGTGVLELVNAPASQVAALDERAEFLLNEPAGTVTLTADPRLTRRRIRVTFSTPGDAGRFRFWEGPTLDKRGRFVAGYAAGNQPIYGTLWTPDGASFIAIVAPPGSGKGSIQRLLILEAAICPDIFSIGIDGKRGKGLGYCRRGFDFFADTPKKWATAFDMLIAETERRSSDSHEADSFVLRSGSPRTFTAVDDLPEVLAACPAAGKQLNRMSAQDRSLGKGMAIAVQQGGAPSYGGASFGTTTRSNFYDNGWLWAGPATDSQARQAVKQGFNFDPGSLPNEKGWAAVMGKHLGDQPIVPSRTLWIPNRTDVNEHGMEAPYGTVEDWLERDAVHPEICDGMREIFFPATAEAPVAPTFATAPVLRSAPIPAPAESDGWSRIVKVLRDNPAGLTRGPIAKAAGLSPKHTSDLLREKAKVGQVVQDTGAAWRLAS
jgi:hypothetical protein